MCGHNKIVSLDNEPSHDIIENILEHLKMNKDRTGYDPIADVAGGAGVKFYTLPTPFIQRKIREGHFKTTAGQPVTDLTLEDQNYGIGRYFLSKDAAQSAHAKKIIEENARAQGLKIVGWRYLNDSVNQTALSAKANEYTPDMWDAILVPDVDAATESFNLERAMLTTALLLENHAAAHGDVNLSIVSHSSEAWIFKGLIPVDQMGAYYPELLEPDFTATAADHHGRDPTAKDPTPEKAHPCGPFGFSHNGEFNSCDSTHAQLTARHAENKRRGITSILPKKGITDSMLITLDMLDLLITEEMNIYTALLQLMPPLPSKNYSDEVNAMIAYQRLLRNPHNGPAAVLTGHNGYHIIALDTLSLRPLRYTIMQDANGKRRFYAGSEDLAPTPPGGMLIESAQLEAGGMLMITPEGDVLRTAAILNRISDEFNKKNHTSNYFQTQLKEHLVTLPPMPAHSDVPKKDPINTIELHRKAVAAFMHKEDEDRILKMAATSLEGKGALGNDTSSLHEKDSHISNSMHRKHAQVTAPALSPMLDPQSFHLSVYIGDQPNSSPRWKRFALPSVLHPHELEALTQQSDIKVYRLDTTFSLDHAKNVSDAIKQLLAKLATLVEDPNAHGFLILSDEKIGPNNIPIPDLRAITEVRAYLESIGRFGDFPIISDSRQIATPHQAALQITYGVATVYPRTALEIITHHYQGHADEHKKQTEGCHQFIEGLKKEIAGDMGEVGITDLGNYRVGQYANPLGINIHDDPHLALLGNYSPLKGATEEDLSHYAMARHQKAYDPNFNGTVLPRSGFLMPNPGKDSIAHTFSHKVSNAIKEFFAAIDNDDRSLPRIHHLSKKLGICDNYLSEEQLQYYTKEYGYLDTDKRKSDDCFDLDVLEDFKPSVAFKKLSDIINKIRTENPITLYDHLQIDEKQLAIFKEAYDKTPAANESLQSLVSILEHFSSGNISYGALTKEGWLAILYGTLDIGMLASAGEGGRPQFDLAGKPVRAPDIEQYAAGHFGVNIEHILQAKRIVVKVSQSAKPGSYAEVPADKMDEEKAATRGCPEGTHVTSRTYILSVASIEDLTPLHRLLQSINPEVEVDIKIATPADDIASTIRGASRKGYNFDLGSNSGGTGAAKLGSRNAGFPGLLGLLRTIRVLRESGYTKLITVQVSDSFITALDILKAFIAGADRVEFGTTGMFTIGCEGDRNCFGDCSTGVATNPERFKGQPINTSLYFLSVSAQLQEYLQLLGVKNLKDIQGHTELLSVIDPEFDARYGLSSLLKNPAPIKEVSPEKLARIKQEEKKKIRSQIETDLMVTIEQELEKAKAAGKPLNFVSDTITLSGKEHGFGAGIAGKFYFYLKENPDARITLNTEGIAGQFYGFGIPKGMSLTHRGRVQEKWAESVEGGSITLIAHNDPVNAEQPTKIAGGNLGLYGCNDGDVNVVGDVGNNFRPLGKGGSVTVRGNVGDFGCKYMTDGTVFLIAKQVGRQLGTSIRGGIIFLYDPDGSNAQDLSNELRIAETEEASTYAKTIRHMLVKHLEKTVVNESERAQFLENFDISKVKVLIPTALDKKNTLTSILKMLSSYHLRKADISPGVKVWLTQKVLALLQNRTTDNMTEDELTVLHRALNNASRHPHTLPPAVYQRLQALRPVKSNDIEQLGVSIAQAAHQPQKTTSSNVVEIKRTHPKNKKIADNIIQVRPLKERLSHIGVLDKKMPPIAQNIFSIVSLLKDEAGRCGCLSQDCTSTTDSHTGCTKGNNIQSINSILKKMGPISPNNILTIQQWTLLRQAAELQFEKSLSRLTGHICTAPCEHSEEGLNGGCTVATYKDNDPVAIKKIEYLLGAIVNSDEGLGWMTGEKTKQWTEEELTCLFGSGAQGKANKQAYDELMTEFGPIVKTYQGTPKTNRIIIIGGGPAGEAAAEKFAKNGYANVHIYEASARFGGLSDCGIPIHKGVNDIPHENLNMLRNHLGVTVHLNSEVIYDPNTQAYYVKGDEVPIGASNSDDTIIVCTGTGKSRALEKDVIKDLDETQQRKIIDGTLFLKMYNLIGNLTNQLTKLFDRFNTDAQLTHEDDRHQAILTFLTEQSYVEFKNKDAFIQEIHHTLTTHKDDWTLQDKKRYLDEVVTEKAFLSSLGVNPIDKKIGIIGFGDTAIDVSRSYSHLSDPNDPRYTEKRGATAYSRAPEPNANKLPDELKLCREEMFATGATTDYLVEPHHITYNPNTDKFSITLKRSHYKCAADIKAFGANRTLTDQERQDYEELKALFHKLPRHKQIIDRVSYETGQQECDIIFLAMGFTNAEDTHPLLASIPKQDRDNLFLAGDAVTGSTKTVVHAQASAQQVAAEIMTKLEAKTDEKVTYASRENHQKLFGNEKHSSTLFKFKQKNEVLHATASNKLNGDLLAAPATMSRR